VTLGRQTVAEFLGTLRVAFGGCGSAVFANVLYEWGIDFGIIEFGLGATF
jgi:glycerol uptake facilitator-like aquaporin